MSQWPGGDHGGDQQPSFQRPSWGPEPWQHVTQPPPSQPQYQPVPPGPTAPTQPTAPLPPPARQSPPRPRLATVVAVSAVTALLVGGGAGYGGMWLARSTGPGTPVATGGAPTALPAPAGASSTRPTPARAPGGPAGAPSDVSQVAEAVLPSTVTIAFRNAGRTGTGSGFVIDGPGGLLITNNHVVEPASGGGELQVQLPSGERVPAEIVGRSPSYDLAVIRVAQRDQLVPVQLGDSDSVRPGQPVVAVGAPLGLGGTVTSGIVSAVERPLSVGGGQSADDAVAYINGIQTDASINPGNSGGPLADAQGRIVGVNSAILTLGGSSSADRGGNIGLGFAIPINQVREISDQLVREGRATYPVIGASVSADADGVVRLASVQAGGPSAAAGLRSGDIVESVDGKAVNTATELIVRVRSHRPTEQVKLSIRGRGEVAVTLGSRVG